MIENQKSRSKLQLPIGPEPKFIDRSRQLKHRWVSTYEGSPSSDKYSANSAVKNNRKKKKMKSNVLQSYPVREAEKYKQLDEQSNH